MEIKKRVYLKAVEEMVQSVQLAVNKSLEELHKHVGENTPHIMIYAKIDSCSLEKSIDDLKGECDVRVYDGSKGETLMKFSYELGVGNKKSLKDYEKNLKNKKSSV